MRHDSQASPSEELRRIAESKVHGYGHELSPGQREAAAELRADICTTGLRHGITPEDWGAVAGLDIECLDAIRWRDRTNRSRPRSERSLGHDSTHSHGREQRGRDLP